MPMIIKSTLKLFFNKKTIDKIAERKIAVQIYSRTSAINIMSKTPLLASIYYMFFSNAFKRESYIVMQGMVKYNKNLQNEKSSIYQLRRNIHRLEKGLIMIPRRTVFAKDYILATVKTYINILNSLDKVVNDDLIWANDVLTKYFSVTTEDVIIDKARSLFEVEKIKGIESQEQKIPYKRDLNTTLVNYEDFFKLSVRRRSVRWYLPKTVPRNLVDRAILAGSQAPSACNRQPYKFRIIDDADLLSVVSKIPGGTAGWDHNFKMIIVVIGDLSAYFSERDRHVIYIDASLATMNLLLALETQGLSSCVINWPDVEQNEVKISNTLKLPKNEKVIMLVSVGWPDPDGLIPYSQKKKLEELRGYN
ncbi:MAG: nitroreductase [Francisellaceae bacterium]|jgi:nitroreductase